VTVRYDDNGRPYWDGRDERKPLRGDFDAAIKRALEIVKEKHQTHWFGTDPAHGLYAIEPHIPFTSPPMEDRSEIEPGWSLIHIADSLDDARKRHLALHYHGPKLPKWWADGVELRVKSTPILRKYGLRTTEGSSHLDRHVGPGEVGRIVRREGNGWWNWVIEFERGRLLSVNDEALGSLARVKVKSS
jgi:hypothetical protein